MYPLYIPERLRFRVCIRQIPDPPSPHSLPLWRQIRLSPAALSHARSQKRSAPMSSAGCRRGGRGGRGDWMLHKRAHHDVEAGSSAMRPSVEDWHRVHARERRPLPQRWSTGVAGVRPPPRDPLADDQAAPGGGARILRGEGDGRRRRRRGRGAARGDQGRYDLALALSSSVMEFHLHVKKDD